MKKPLRLNALLLTVIMLAASAVSPRAALAAAPADDFRAVWVSSVVNLDFPSKKGLDSGGLKKEIDAVITDTAAMNLNAIILQVRPTGDALYKSAIFPWSEYLTGTQGAAPEGGFDPLAYWVERAHAAGLELHAWVNPYRITMASAQITDTARLAANNPARLNPARAIAYKDALYYDPGLPENKKLIIDGVAEIIKNYDVDGIHLDDYFYPGTDFNDGASYAKYGGGMAKDGWRRENVNDVIKGIQKTVAETKPGARFGVSPFAIWQNASSSPLGSDTRGNEAYIYMYADTRRWVKEGWLDYICPQIYWHQGFAIADYTKIVKWWADVCAGTGVDLYVGHAAYKEAEQYDGWSAGETVRQLSHNALAYPGIVKGSVFFRYSSINGALSRQIADYYAHRGEPAPVAMTGLSVAQPSSDVSVTAKGYHVFGASDPARGLTLNGQEVVNRTAEGFFSTYVQLEKGENVLRFSQGGGADAVRTITLKDPPAPAASTPPPAAVPDRLVSREEGIFATVTADSAWAYGSAGSGGGSDRLLLKGQKDAVAAVSGDGKWVKLATGMWVEAQNVAYAADGTKITNALSGGVYAAGENTDSLRWSASAYPASSITFDGAALNIAFALQKDLPRLALSDAELGGTVFKAVRGGVENGVPYYSFDIKDTARIDGYYVGYADGVYSLNIKKRRALSPGDRPLAGFTIMVDAGHGQDDTGAIGPMGTALAEKHINLINATKLADRLARLGATVVNTRADDTFLTLQQRADLSRRVNPDLFISMHANSMAESTDSSNVKGLSLWYRNPGSKALADSLLNGAFSVNPMTTRRRLSNQSNFYVCRPAWCPSVIVEASFMCNINDFSWLINPARQDELADSLAGAVVAYYAASAAPAP